MLSGLLLISHRKDSDIIEMDRSLKPQCWEKLCGLCSVWSEGGVGWEEPPQLWLLMVVVPMSIFWSPGTSLWVCVSQVSSGVSSCWCVLWDR